MRRENLENIEDTFTRLKILRDSYSEVIPAEIIQSHSPENLFKVRHGWFMSVGSVLEDGVERGEIADEEVMYEVEEFWKWLKSDKFTGGDSANRRTTREDIDRGNAMINQVFQQYRPEWVLGEK